MITIWGGATARTLRPHWALAELELDYEPQLIGSRTGATQKEEFRALNIKEKIPVMIDTDAPGGKLVLTESVAIVTYLGDTYAPHTGFVPPPHTRERARYNEWVSFIQMELDAHTLYVMRKHRDLSDLYGEAPAALEAAAQGFNKQVQFAVKRLKEQPYLVGPAFSAADLILMTCLDWAHAYGFTLDGVLEEYREGIHKRPAFQKARELNFSISAGA